MARFVGSGLRASLDSTRFLAKSRRGRITTAKLIRYKAILTITNNSISRKLTSGLRHMEKLDRCCNNCAWAYNSVHSSLVQCKIKERLAYKSKTGQTNCDFKWDKCYWWRNRSANAPLLNWKQPAQMQLHLF